MEDLKQDINYLSNEATNYIDTEVKLAKLELVDQVSHFSASIFSRVVLLMMAGISYMLLMAALAVYLYPLFEPAWVGPVITVGVSIILLLLIGAARKYLLEGPFQDYVISHLSKNLIS